MSIIKKLEDSIWAKVILAVVVVVLHLQPDPCLRTSMKKARLTSRQQERQYVRRVMQRQFRKMIYPECV